MWSRVWYGFLDYDIYDLLDPSAKLPFVTYYLSMIFDMTLEVMLEPYSVYTYYCWQIYIGQENL